MVATTSGAVRPDEIRRHNLALMLAHVHRDGALSRAELTQRLQISRSTVKSLVGDLTQLGLLEEAVPTGGPGANAGVGRPSHVVGPHRGGPYVVAVDVDVDRTTFAAVGIGGRVLDRTSVETSQVATPLAFVQRIATAVDAFRAAHPAPRLVGVGVGIPGTVAKESGHVGVAPNLGWRDVALGELVREAVPGVAVRVGNDADLAMMAEHQRGNARGSDDAVYLMSRIGVGAGIITGGVPLRGHRGNAGELGHNVLDPAGPPCHCGRRGCVEVYIGTRALPASASGDPAVLAVAADHAGHVIGDLVNTVDPQRVVLGGSLSVLVEHARPQLEAAVDRYVFQGHGLELCAPGLGDDSALLGAAEAAFAPLLVDPFGMPV